MGNYSKSLYRIGEVACLLDVPITTLKYWTDTFDEVRPQRVGTGRQVKYRPEDIETLKLIRHLMYDKVMSIEGSKRHLSLYRAPRRAPRCDSQDSAVALLREVKAIVQDNPKAIALLGAIEKWITRSATQKRRACDGGCMECAADSSCGWEVPQ